MDIGTGIAIAGVWLLPTAALLSPTASSAGFWFSVLISSTVTLLLAI
jgi:hypothetical protein